MMAGCESVRMTAASPSSPPPFRFGLQIPLRAESLLDDARAAEADGFDVVTVADHIGPGLAPLVALGAIAQATSTIRIGTFVLNAELRNPVQLAWEASTLDRLSGGRFELGVGAGHTPAEFAAVGVDKAPGRVRKARLMESVEILNRLLAGDIVDHSSDFFTLEEAAVDPAQQDHLPILVGGNGDALLRHAGQHGDIIGLQGLGRTLEDGHRHTVDWSPTHLDDQVASVEAGEAGRRDDRRPERNALVQVVSIDEDADVTAKTRADLLDRVDGLQPDHLDQTPYACIGSVDEVVAKLEACRDRWGISYFVVRDRDAFAPVVERLGGN